MAAKYNIRAVPSIVVDGKVVQVGIPNDKDIKRLNQVIHA
ncbi:MAG: thioredoxin family protein [Candidatus Marinimicrobia bacterium]|nr:thioredoxin family protein [Candidatus Neomarinimicrobiota bacterium]MBL7022445.1 thioredoxin family protein [Candidatus Neomarinimicrobiota bacterium]MBL7108700.1 thioredoxin family protein [Candidatus Neomarinimicrobiota bacterium]